MAVKLELYRVFKEVADTGNISAAAKNLYISQSAVSQSIKQLETALQARLFARSPRGVTLTNEGQMLYQYVRSALGLLATGEDKLTQAQQLLIGSLVIGASDTVTSWYLAPFLERFHREHPGIHLRIVRGRSGKVLSLLRSGAVEAAPMMCRIVLQTMYTGCESSVTHLMKHIISAGATHNLTLGDEASWALADQTYPWAQPLSTPDYWKMIKEKLL